VRGGDADAGVVLAHVERYSVADRARGDAARRARHTHSVKRVDQGIVDRQPVQMGARSVALGNGGLDALAVCALKLLTKRKRDRDRV